MRKLKRSLALLLTLVMLITVLPVQAFAYLASQNGAITIVDQDGNTVTTDESWEATFPNGTFAFGDFQAVATEGGQTTVIKVMRLGGTAGRAIAYVSYEPTMSQMPDGTVTYSTAAGSKDIMIEAEDPLPGSEYQPIGQPDEPLAPDTPVAVKRTDTEDGVTLSVDVEADSYQWYVYYAGWEVISGAEESTFVTSAEDLAEYDFRCVFTVDGTEYCSDSYLGYAPDEFTGSAAVAPDGEDTPVVDLNAEPTFTRINPVNEEDPYLGYVFDLTFAEGEWVKEIRVTVPDDSEAEPLKFGTFTIVAQEGASLYDTANTLSLRVEDNDAAEESTLGFSVTEIRADKASGTAELTVVRTGGNQTMVTIDYATEDGTAVAGEDYAETSGTLTFYGDLNEQTIRIPLIDDGKVTDEETDFRVVLSNLKGDGEVPCTLKATEAVVSLYNSGESDGQNLATYLHETEVTDLSGSVSEADAAAPVDDNGITAVQTTEEMDEAAVAKYVSSETGDVTPFSYNYPNKLEFGHYTNYWTYADEMPSSGWNGGGSNNDYIRYVHSKGASSATLNLDPRMYEGIYAKMGWRCALASGNTLFWYGTEYTYPWVRLLKGDGSEFARADSGHYHTSQNITTKLYYTPDGSMLKQWTIADNVTQLQIGTSRYDSHDADSNAEANVKKGSMVYRRYFKGDFYLTVHTANDENTKPADGATLTEDSGVYQSMQPQISISGGGAHYGDLFVGTTLKIDLKNTASYVPATADDNLSYAVYLTDNNGRVVPAQVSNSGSTYYVTLLWNGMTDDDVNNKSYTINVVMTRKQNLKVDISPSVPRLTDEDGMPTGSIDTTKIGAAVEAFWSSTNGGITYGYSVEKGSGSTIAYEQKTGTFNKNGYTLEQAMMTFAGIENLQWINFNLPAEDKIVYNGRTYDGNEKIYLTVEDLASSNMLFYYYESAYLSSVSTMVATIAEIELFLDANGDGMINGYYGENGYFILEEDENGNTLDVGLGFLDPDLSYNELYFQPVKLDDGTYAQYFMKVYYNMNPRSLIPEAGTDTTTKAQVLPAFVSTITEGDSYERLTEEQKAYRYIISGRTKLSETGGSVRSSDNHVMYGSEASARSMVDIPLGGDISPAKLNEARTAYTWTPNYQGNLLYPFKNPEPITIDESLAGTNIPVAGIARVDASGNVTLEDDGAAKLNGYLGSLTANNTVALCVQEQTMTTEEIASANGVTIGGGDVVLQSEGDASGSLNVESVNTSDNKITPDARHLQAMSSGNTASTATMDMGESGFDYPEFNQDLSVDLPSTEISVTDFGSIVMDGDQVGFTFGLPLGGFNSSGDAGAGGTGGSGGDHRTGTGDAIKSSAETIANIFKWFRHPRSMAKEVDDSYQSVTDERDSSNSSLRTGKKVSSREFAAEFSVSAAFMFKYDPITNRYEFSQFAMAVAAELSFSYQARFTPCPILYIYVTVHFDVEFSIGADVERETVCLEKNLITTDTTDTSDNRRYNDLKKGESVVVNNRGTIESDIFGNYDYNFEALNLNFNGTVLLEAFKDANCTEKLDDFQSGYLSSTGSDDVLVILGQEVSQDVPIYLKITALEDTKLYSGNLVLTSTNKTTFGGFTISPELYAQVGAGVGIEILKAEIYAKINVGCTMAFGNYNEDAEKDYEGFRLREFDFGMALGVSVQALFFSYDLDLIGLNVSYDWEGDPRWTYTWSALNGAYGGDLRTQSEGEDDYGVHVRLPGSSANTQNIYSSSFGGSDLDPLAFDPNDENVPFQLSGYGSSGDAFKLADGLASGYEYQVVTVGDQNYLLYTISRTDAAHPVDNSMLVLSRLQLTDASGKETYGLVNPVDAGDSTPYIIVDNDKTGDLEFIGWADGKTIHIAWVSYAEAAESVPSAGEKPASTCPSGMTEENYKEVYAAFVATEPTEVKKPTAPTEPVRSDYYVTRDEYDALTPEEQAKYNSTLDTTTGNYFSNTYSSYTDAEAAYKKADTKYQTDLEQYEKDEAAYQDYLAKKAAYDAQYPSYKAWYEYFLSVETENNQNQVIADAAAKNTVVKTASFDTAAAKPTLSTATTVSNKGSHVYLPGGSTDGTVTIYAQARHYANTTAQENAYAAYLKKLYPDSMGDGAKSIRAYRAAYQKGLWDAYGEGTELYAVVDDKAIGATVPDGGIVDNMEITQIDGIYYVAYTTSKQAYVDGSGQIIQDGTNAEDMITTKQLYLQTLTLENDAPKWGDALLLRTLVDYDQSSTKDGVYSGSNRTSAYQDPYFANLQFLNGKLGNSLTGGTGTEVEEFLLFEMNGSTYVIPEDELKNIATSKPGTIYPFFQPEKQTGTDGEDATPSSTGRSEVTIGADGAGNISAVYVANVEGTTNNALYLTKWDPTSGTWGAGTMLAMNYMQVYEDAAANGWTAEETEKAYLGKLDGYTGGGMDQFVFSDLQIALGQTNVTGSDASTQSEGAEVMVSADLDRIQQILGGDVQTFSAGEMTDEQARALVESLSDEQLSLLAEKSNEGSRDTLLVLTRGVTTELKEYNGYIVPKEQTGTANGTGIYAISYGVGQQEVGNATAEFAEYDFTAGSQLFLTGSFQNIGDVGLRGSEANPITVKLMLKTSDSDPGTELATWEIKENIPAGKVVNLSGTCKALSQDLPEGSTFSFLVSEDKKYSTDAFSGETNSFLEVEDKPELRFEFFSISSSSVDANGNTILDVEFQVGNRGTKIAEDVYVQFRYESDRDDENNAVYAPLDITNNNLSVSEQQALEPLADNTDAQNGILRLNNATDGDDIDPNKGRTVTGTITVPPTVYKGAENGSLNLQVEIFSGADENVVRGTNGLITADHGEYNGVNNVRNTAVEHATYFDTADQVTLAIGTTLRLPVSIATSTGADPVIQVLEVPDTQNGEKNLGVLYYQKSTSTGTGNTEGYIVISPSKEGTGVLEIKDQATNTIHPVAYKVTSVGEGINIFKDNEFFTFYNSDKSEYNPSVAAGSQDWTFDDKANQWGSGENTEAPYRLDLAKGKTGAYFTFDTVAESIDFHFNGKIQVSSTYPGFRAVELTSTGGKDNYASVSFGSQGETHTVTVKVLDSGYSTTDFDVIVEHYPDGEPPVPSADATSPHLYWSRSFPQTASVETSQNIKLTLYVLDDTGLSSLTVNGTEPANIQKSDDDCFWSVELTLTENGPMKVETLDNSGNRTTQSVQVDWFNSTTTPGAISSEPGVTADFYKNTLPGIMGPNDYIKQGDTATLKATSDTAGVTFSAQRLTVSETTEGVSELTTATLQPKENTDNTFDATANGFYVVKATDPTNGTWSQVVKQMTQVDDNLPAVGLTYVEADQALRWNVTKANPTLSPIKEAKINGYDVLGSQSGTNVGGTFSIEYGGTYTLTGTDEAGNKFEAKCDVELPIYAKDGADPATVTNVTDYNTDNGIITIHPDALRGGTYDPAKSTEETNNYVGSYEWRLVEKADDPSNGSDAASNLAQLLADDEQWVTTEELTGLAPGDYTLYIRDANDKDNEETVLRVQLTLDRTVGDERITLSFEEKTDEDGKRYLDWSAKKGSDPLEPITSVTINGQSVITGSGTELSGTWDLRFAGKYTLEAKDSGATPVTISKKVTVTDFPVTVSAPGKLAVVQHPWNQVGDNGTVTLHLVDADGTTQLVTGGLYDTATSNTADGVYVGSYEWLLTTPFTFDREAALEALKKDWLEEHPDQTTIPEKELVKLEAQADQQETEAKNKWLTDLLADDEKWADLTTAGGSVTGLKAGDYALLIRDAQDPDNIKTVYQQELTLNNQRITLTATSSSASGGQNNGSVTARAEGGYLDRSTYQFAIRPITGQDDTVTIDQMTSALNREKFPEEVYAAPKWDIPDFTVLTDPDEINETSYAVLKTAVLDGLAPGWYQVAVRPMLNVTTDDLVGLAKLAATYTAADLAHQQAVDNASEAGIARQTAQRIQDLQTALNTWRTAADEDKDAAFEAYKALIGSNQTILDALTAWEQKGFVSGEEKNVYDEAVKTYFTNLVTTESQKAEADAAAALETAKKAYDDEYARLMGVADAAYSGADADIGWGNGTTVTAYVSRATSSNKINVSDLRYPDDETVEVHFTRSKTELSTAAEQQLIKDNETRNIEAYSDTMMAVIPVGTLQKGDNVMDMLMPTVKIPEDTLGTVVECTTPDGKTSYVPWSAVTLGKVWYIADQPGEYRLVTNLVSFADVPETFWGYKAITFTAAREIFQGVDDGLFSPNGTMTRAMLVTVLGRLAGIDPADYAGQSKFTDVDADSWYGPYVAWAAENGVVNGVGNGKFAPNSSITREQLCTMLVRYLGGSGLDLPNVEDPAAFSDQTQISTWAAESVELFRLSGIVEGFDGAFRPQKSATRAEVSTIFYRLITGILTNM